MEDKQVSSTAPIEEESSAIDPSYIKESRLSLPLPIRLPTAAVLGFLSGFGLGASHGGTMAGMRFRAENAHRFPTTSTGWYLYHKTKNYNIAFASIKEGMRMGGKVSFWASSFLVFEYAIDEGRGSKDLVSTAAAGLSVAGLFSVWNRFPLMTTMRTMQTGLYGGLAFGLLQDAMALVRGRRLRYVEFVKEVLGVGQKSAEEGNT